MKLKHDIEHRTVHNGITYRVAKSKVGDAPDALDELF